MRIHVTGGRGFLGGYVERALQGHDLTITDVDDLDITDPAAVTAAFEADRPDVVVHLAGLTGANPSLKDPHRFFEVGTTGTQNVLEACRRAEVRGLVFMSTLTVHGNTEGGTVDEDSPLRPRHPYAGAKAAAEMVVRTYAQCFELRAVTLRATLIAGEGQREPNAIGDFLECCDKGEPIEIYGEGTHAREWLHPEDLADAVRAAAEHAGSDRDPASATVIVSSGQPISMAELARKIIARTGRGELVFRPSTRQAFSLCTRSTRAADILGWKPRIDIDGIIERLADGGG